MDDDSYGLQAEYCHHASVVFGQHFSHRGTVFNCLRKVKFLVALCNSPTGITLFMCPEKGSKSQHKPRLDGKPLLLLEKTRKETRKVTLVASSFGMITITASRMQTIITLTRVDAERCCLHNLVLVLWVLLVL